MNTFGFQGQDMRFWYFYYQATQVQASLPDCADMLEPFAAHIHKVWM